MSPEIDPSPEIDVGHWYLRERIMEIKGGNHGLFNKWCWYDSSSMWGNKMSSRPTSYYTEKSN